LPTLKLPLLDDCENGLMCFSQEDEERKEEILARQVKVKRAWILAGWHSRGRKLMCSGKDPSKEQRRVAP
jgi:hypothetical protein